MTRVGSQRHRKKNITSHCVTIAYSIQYSNILYSILIQKSQQDAHVTEFILSDHCSTCFGYHYHPSSGAQNNCNYNIVLLKMSDNDIRNMLSNHQMK